MTSLQVSQDGTSKTTMTGTKSIYKTQLDAMDENDIADLTPLFCLCLCLLFSSTEFYFILFSPQLHLFIAFCRVESSW